MMNNYSKFLNINLQNGDMGLLKDFLARGQFIAAMDQIHEEVKKMEKNLRTLRVLKIILSENDALKNRNAEGLDSKGLSSKQSQRAKER